jgi:hypothetical protein
MIQIDIKVGHRITGDRTGRSNSRGIGWEVVHVAIKPAPAKAKAGIHRADDRAVAVWAAAFAGDANLGFVGSEEVIGKT